MVGYTYMINSIVFSPDSKKIISGSSYGTVQIWKNPLFELKWNSRKTALLIRFNNHNKLGEAFQFWNIMTTTALFLY